MMKKPVAIALVVLLLGIGAGVFWGTSWHRVIRSTGCDTYSVLDEYAVGGDLYRVVLADRDTAPTFFHMVRKNGIWSLMHSEGEAQTYGVANYAIFSLGVGPLEMVQRYYVAGTRPVGTIQFSSGELPEPVAVRVDQNEKSFLLQFVWFSDPDQHSESHQVRLLDLQQALYRKGLMANPIISVE